VTEFLTVFNYSLYSSAY